MYGGNSKGRSSAINLYGPWENATILGEKALLGKSAIRGATVIASSKAEVFVLSRHQFELLENEGLPIKQIVANVKHKVEQYKKDDQALEDVKANAARAQKIVKRATHVSRQSSSMTWSKEQQISQNEGESDSDELIIEEDDDNVYTVICRHREPK